MKKINVGDIWETDSERCYGFCRYHITAVGENKILAYEHPFPHEKNTIESEINKSWLQNCIRVQKGE